METNKNPESGESFPPVHRCESFDGRMVDHFDDACRATSRDDYGLLVELAQAGLIPDEDGI